MMVILHELTGNGAYLAWARKIADREIAGLPTVRSPEWWRFPERNELLDALLKLHEAVASP